jgi:two-component system, OmpR family, heavy metal sensor histidine kinase CusS
LSSGDASADGSPKPSRRPWSLTLWLALCNAGSAFLILTVISLLLYLALATQLKRQNHLYLHAEVAAVEKLLHSQSGETSIVYILEPNRSGEEYVKHYVRLLDSHQRPLAETPEMWYMAPHAAFKTQERGEESGLDRTWRTKSGNVMMGTSTAVDLGRPSGEQGLLEVAMDVTNVENILESYRHKIYVTLLVGLLLCIVVGLAIARRGTRPLREMTAMVRQVTPSGLKERVSGENWPSEVEALAGAMNGMMDRLQDSFERLYNSARNLSHKVRTPLTIMRGEAEVALSRERSVEELQQVILSNLEENNRLVRLAENILFLADAEMGKFSCSRAEIDAGAEVDKVLDFYCPAAEDRGVAISRQGQARIFADPALLRKAVAALLSNAITYNRPGGEVVFYIRQEEGLAGKVSVADTGCGIERGEQEKIFDRFYRIYATRHMDPHGTGLGLPIAKAIMELHRGEVEVHSEPALGTTVTLNFRHGGSAPQLS